jgi:hypothetical protein
MQTDRSLHPQGSVVDDGGPAIRVAGRLVPDIALGGLVGLLAGITLASLLETFRPTLVGRDALARNLGAPVLAEVQGAGSAEADLAEAAMHIELAAVAARIHHIELLTMRRQQDVGPMAAQLAHTVRGLQVGVISRGGIGPFEGAAGESRPAEVAASESAGSTGVVLVTPKVVRVAELSRIVEFFTISGWPLLGLIVVPARRALLPTLPLGRRRSGSPPGTHAHGAQADGDRAKGENAWTSRF